MKNTTTEKELLAQLDLKNRKEAKAELLRLAQAGSARPEGALGELLDMYTTNPLQPPKKVKTVLEKKKGRV